jgi:hypothetical protein
MASTSKCPYCGGTVGSDEKNCPHCGAENENYVVDTPRQVFLPKTIDELKEYCAERGMPLLRMRFFIGENFKEPRAFGIYRDGDKFVVYKNKSDGSRAIRYRGPDEAYAVNELFLKLLEECHNRGIYPDGKPMQTRSVAASPKRKSSRWIVLFVTFLTLALCTIVLSRSCLQHKKDGYYRFSNDSIYTWYRYGDRWFYSEGTSSDWYSGNPGEWEDTQDSYIGRKYDSDWDVSDFKDSDIWDSIQSDNSSSSSDYDSWDSGGTDWDSDW